MKIIIVGCGKVGKTLAEQLVSEGHEITVIDIDGKKVQHLADRINVMGIEGNGVSLQAQTDAGINTANLLVAVTDSDELNMLSCLIAKKAGNVHTIARIRNPEYREELQFLRSELNLSLVINPERSAAKEIARLIKYPSVMKADTFARSNHELISIVVPQGSPLDDMKVYEVPGKLDCNVLICGVERKEGVVIPDGNFTLKAGDKLSFVGSHSQAMRFFKKIGPKHNNIKSVMIVGGGMITQYLAKELEEIGVTVKIIEKDFDRCQVLSESCSKAIIIHGEGSEQTLLLEEGIESVDAFAALTGIDEENIMFSLYASSVSDCKLITKINRIGFENVISNMDLGSIINPKKITADHVITYVRAMHNSMGSNIETVYKIMNDKAEALEFSVGDEPSITGIPLKDLKFKPNILVASINRNGKGSTPNGLSTIERGDSVIIVTTNTGLHDLKDILA